MSQILLQANHAPADFSRFQRASLFVGLISLAACVIGAFTSPGSGEFFKSYLAALLFWTSLTLGSLALLMIQYLTGGAWGLVIRRSLESATRMLPLLIILFIPVVLGLPKLYSWAIEANVKTDALLQHKAPYLNVPFFLVRTGAYFLLWGITIYFLNRWSKDLDRTGDQRFTLRLQQISGPGILMLSLTLTFASVDWLMSLDPHWYSTMYGVTFMVNTLLSAMSFMIVITVFLSKHSPLREVVRPKDLHDLGKLMLAFTMLWAYCTFSQYLLIWSANLSEETPYYLRRMQGGWGYVGFGLLIFNFVLPFVLMLSSDLKRNARTVWVLALYVFAVRFLDLFWLVAPEPAVAHASNNGVEHVSGASQHAVFHFDWLSVWIYIAALIGIGGIWMWAYLWQLKSRPLLPLHDPYMKETFSSHGH